MRCSPTQLSASRHCHHGARDVPARSTFAHAATPGQSGADLPIEAAASRDVSRSGGGAKMHSDRTVPTRPCGRTTCDVLSSLHDVFLYVQYDAYYLLAINAAMIPLNDFFCPVCFDTFKSNDIDPAYPMIRRKAACRGIRTGSTLRSRLPSEASMTGDYWTRYKLQRVEALELLGMTLAHLNEAEARAEMRRRA